MTPEDGPLRAAYLRLADPVGTPVRLVYTVVSLGCLGAFGLVQRWTWAGRIVPYLVGAAAIYFVVASLRARRFAALGTPAEIRERFCKESAAVLDFAPSLPVRMAAWLGLATWAWIAVARGGPYPLGGDRELAVFIGGIGGLLGARYLYEWRWEVPALRRELSALGIAGTGVMHIGLTPLDPPRVPDRHDAPSP